MGRAGDIGRTAWRGGSDFSGRSLRGASPRGDAGGKSTLPVPSAVADAGSSGGRDERDSGGAPDGGTTRKLPVPVCVTVPPRLVVLERLRAPAAPTLAPAPEAVCPNRPRS